MKQYAHGSKEFNLRAAKHRFETYQKPLGRSCRLVRALMRWVIRKAMHIATLNYGYAVAFLVWISELRYVLAGMMADVADELMGLLRFLDKEDVPLHEMNYRLNMFVSKIWWLLGDGMHILKQGYTKHVIEVLLSEPFVWVIQNKTGSLGGVDAVSMDKVLESAVDVMRGWMKLAVAELNCEFPSFEVVQACELNNKSPQATLHNDSC